MAKYIKGIDVAHWEPQVDWARVRAQDIRFAFIKATQADFADSMFESHWVGAKRAGILRGAYHFIDPRVDGRRQAEAFLRMVKLEPGDLPPVLDLEDLADEFGVDQPAAKRSEKKKGNKGVKGKPGQGTKGAKGINTRQVANEDVVACAEVWLEIVERETGRKPILYSSPSYLESRMRGRNNQTPHWAADYVIWIANYLDHDVTDMDLPLQPKGWPDWKFWQYSDDSFLDGIFNKESTQRTEVDMNFYRGTLEELYALAGATMPDDSAVEIPKTDVLQEVEDGIVVDVPQVPVAEPQANPMTHLIQSGDSLFALAMKYHTTVDAIMAANPQITNPNLIRIGQTLNIPPA
jgi:GH25 family lysozyme M1 (1,4-beta-N-acetylmuramidase)